MEFHHRYISGMTRMGKTTHARDTMMNRIYDGQGCLWLDPHGYDSEWMIDHIPPHRVGDVILFDPTKFSIAINPLNVPVEQRYFLAKTVATAIKILAGYEDISAPRITNTVQFTILALMEAGYPLSEVTTFLTNDTISIPRPVPEGRRLKKDKVIPFHRVVRDKLKDKLQRQFWDYHFDRTGKEQREYVDSSLSQFYNLLLDPRIRQSFSQRKASFSIQDVLDNNLIFIARLPQGQLGLDTVTIIGSLLLCLFHIAGLARTSRVPFTIVADEGHTWVAPPMMEILSGGGKFQLWLMFIHQYLGQFKNEQLLEALMGNCGEKHIFRMSREDSLRFERERPKNNDLFNIYELAPYTYRILDFSAKARDGKVSPLTWPEFPKNRRLIEGRMRHDFVKGGG